MSNYELVKLFHERFGAPVAKCPTRISRDRVSLRKSLIREEMLELFDEMHAGNLVGIAKEASDLLVVTYGTLIEYGIDADKVFSEVHESNMSKLGEDGKPIMRADGKILKGPNYVRAEPGIKRFVSSREIDDDTIENQA